MSQLREACVHGRWEAHTWSDEPVGSWDYPSMMVWTHHDCPGGRVLDQAIIIEKAADGNWPLAVIDALTQRELDPWVIQEIIEDALASAQEKR